ncbi:MAG: AzlC family ABC transporter permease [Deltaproteobacteria bacterium]|nr:AzlC family ABC transporter permease [Deltaproteobacteria bacterium]
MNAKIPSTAPNAPRPSAAPGAGTPLRAALSRRTSPSEDEDGDGPATFAGDSGKGAGFWKAFKADYLAGFTAGAPILMGLVPFGLIFGATARNAGLSWIQAQAMSLGIFAGSAQLVFLNLWNEGVNAFALLLTVLCVNLRLVIYSSSLAPFFGPPATRAAGLARGYFLTDESYAISMAAFLKEGFARNPAWFFLGAAGPTWSGWQLMTASGYLAGTFLPESVPFAMAIPMVFLALLISVMKSSRQGHLAKATAGLAAGLGVVIFREAPHNMGLVLAILTGVAAGAITSRAGLRAKGDR